jgi:RNA polymerase sigma-70 factor (family 1)
LYQEEGSYEEEKLLALLTNGSEYAFQLIYNKHHNRIYKVAMRYLKSPVIAEEVVQDVFLQLWSKRDRIKTGMPVEAWLFTVAKNNIFNRLKKLANEWKALNYLKDNFEYEDDTLQEKLVDADYNNMLNKALSSLSEMQLKVYKLAKEENLSYFQISENLNISPLTVKTHMSRALSQIRNFLTAMRWNVVSLLVFCFWNPLK